MKVWLALAALIITGIALPYYLWKQSSPLDYTREDVEAVWLQPVPEGPQSPTFALHPNEGDRSLSKILDAVPSPLPRDVWQGFNCDLGGDVVVELHDGNQLRYGPCRRPGPIEDLRREILRTIGT